MGGPPWSPWCLLPNGRYPGYLHCLVDDGPQKPHFFQGQLPEGQPSLLNLLHFFWGQHPTMTTLPSWTYLEFFCHGFPVPFHGDSEKQFGQPIWTTTSSLLRTTPCCDNTAILNVLGFLESCIPVPFHSNSERHLGQPASNDREESPEGKFLFYLSAFIYGVLQGTCMSAVDSPDSSLFLPTVWLLTTHGWCPSFKTSSFKTSRHILSQHFYHLIVKHCKNVRPILYDAVPFHSMLVELH